MRERHVLRRNGTTPYPEMVVVVQATCRQKYLGEADDVGTLTLEWWHAAYATVHDGKLIWVGSGHGEAAAKWWNLLDDVADGCTRVHIYSWQAREVMAALGLWDQLADGEYTLRMHDPLDRPDVSRVDGKDTQGYVVLQAPPTIVAFHVKDRQRKYTWLDPQNYGIKSIGAYAEQCDSDVAEQADAGQEFWINGHDISGLTRSVARFVVSYYEALQKHNLGGPEHTAATQAMAAFRANYMRHRIEIHDSLPAIKLERAALYGGRCECYFLGELFHADPSLLPEYERSNSPCVRYDCGQMYYLDVNSLYPSVVLEANLPTRLQGLTGRIDAHTMLAAAKATGVIAAVQVKTDVPCVPVRIDGRILYPVGTFDTVLCGPELTLASQYGARLKCYSMAVYEMAPIYGLMSRVLLTARQQYAKTGDERMRQVVKSILNAAFGKWAQRSKKWVDVPHVLPLRPYMQWWEQAAIGDTVQYRSIGWNVQRMDVLQEEGADTFPAITAYINSLGRVKLWELLQTAGDGNVYYCDTDSLICNQYGYDALESSGCIGATEIGKLKVLADPHHVRIYGRQAYELDGQLTISGASGKVRRAGDAFVEELVAPPIGYYLAKEEAPGMERRVARVRVNRAYNQGHVREDGTVEPARFGHGKTE